MGLPNVILPQLNGNLGRTEASDDGISGLIASGVAVGGQFALGDVLKFRSLEEVEAKQINAAYDSTNTCMVYQHCKDFFAIAGKGATLYLMVVAKTVTLAQMLDNSLTTYAKKLTLAAQGKIRLLGVTRVPQSGYSPTYATQLDTDIITAITNSIAFRDAEYDSYRPVQIFVEGRDWQGGASATLDLRDPAGLLANRTSLIIGQDSDVATTYTWAPKYAAVGLALGKAASMQVNSNIGRVNSGKLPVINAGFSNNASYDTFTDANRDTLNDKGYIFLRNFTGLVGWFFNDFHTCTKISDDFAYGTEGRAMDKVSRIAYATYVQEILNSVLVDASSGKLLAATCKMYEALIEKAVNEAMTAKNEISGIKAFCDKNQDVIATSKVTIQVDVVPTGTNRTIEVDLAFSNPS